MFTRRRLIDQLSLRPSQIPFSDAKEISRKKATLVVKWEVGVVKNRDLLDSCTYASLKDLLGNVGVQGPYRNEPTL